MKIKIYIVAEYNRYDKRYDYCAWPCHPGGIGGKVFVEEREIEFDAPPDSALVAGTVKSYRKEQQRIRAEMMGKVNALQQSIDEMLCLEYKKETT